MVFLPRVDQFSTTHGCGGAVRRGAAFSFQFCIGKENPINKHTKHRLFFYGALLLTIVAAFCVMFVLPLIISGRSPPHSNLHK